RSRTTCPTPTPSTSGTVACSPTRPPWTQTGSPGWKGGARATPRCRPCLPPWPRPSRRPAGRSRASRSSLERPLLRHLAKRLDQLAGVLVAALSHEIGETDQSHQLPLAIDDGDPADLP